MATRFSRSMFRSPCAVALAFACLATSGCLAEGSDSAGSSGRPGVLGVVTEPVPIPPSETSLPTVEAQTYFKVSDEGLNLEGPSFDRAGNLLFVETAGGRVFSLSPDRQLTTVVQNNELASAGLAIHKDGRLFVAGLGNFKDSGSLVTYSPAGARLQTIIDQSQGMLVDDLVFDEHGGFYFTDFRGSTTEPTGGAYYMSPDLKTTTPIVPNLAAANGVALNPDGKTLWVTEYSMGRLHRIQLSDATTVAPFGTTVTYQFTGAPDSMRADSAGNLYVAIYGQGRVLVFNETGIPIGQILIPGRREGHNLVSTSMAIRPDTDELYIVVNDGSGGEGATIFNATALAKALPLFSHK
jgi:lactonase